MAKASAFRPDWESAPGDTIRDVLRERSLSTDELAVGLGRDRAFAESLIRGTTPITIAVARLLTEFLGGSVAFWMSRDYQYREDTARSNGEWLAGLPLDDMVRFGWLPETNTADTQLRALFAFFGVTSVQALRQKYTTVRELIAFRTSTAFESKPAAVAAWLRQGELRAATIECQRWNPIIFRERLADLRVLTRQKDPTHFLPILSESCGSAGVAVVVVRAPSGCRASGATAFVAETKAMLLLSFRYLSDDHFWFSFFHEAGHLLLHGDRLFLESAEGQSTNEEREANDFAADVLVPGEYHGLLDELPIDSREIIRFARHIGVSPGVVVGQLQHRKRIRHNQLNRLKRRFRWDD